MASHRSNVRDTVLHLEIINPVAGKTPSYLDWDRALYSASSIYSELDYQRVSTRYRIYDGEPNG